MNRAQKEQALYLADEARLNLWIHEESPLTAIGGERQRSGDTQQAKFDAGLSKARRGESAHEYLRAQDLEFFDVDGSWLEVPVKSKFPDVVSYLEAVRVHKSKVKHVGMKWESLDPLNFWGGNIKGLYDPGHFERREK